MSSHREDVLEDLADWKRRRTAGAGASTIEILKELALELQNHHPDYRNGPMLGRALDAIAADRTAEFAAFREIDPSAVTHCVLVGRKIKSNPTLKVTRAFEVYSAGWFWRDEDGSTQYTIGLALHNGESFRLERSTTTEDFARTF